jgi:hypothetical protein
MGLKGRVCAAHEYINQGKKKAGKQNMESERKNDETSSTKINLFWGKEEKD